MSVSSLCQLCESARATHTCEQCGAAVCGDHYDRAHGLCTRCAGALSGSDSLQR